MKLIMKCEQELYAMAIMKHPGCIKMQNMLLMIHTFQYATMNFMQQTADIQTHMSDNNNTHIMCIIKIMHRVMI